MQFVKPPLVEMRKIAAQEAGDGTDIALDVYCSEQTLFREFFWYRLSIMTHLIRRHGKNRGSCLDFGGGSGVYLPSLQTGFGNVSLIDLNTRHAERMIAALDLSGVRVVNRDIRDFDFDNGEFNAVVAADVLEHFPDPRQALGKIRNWLADNGTFFTSLPTENFAYRFLRIIFRKTKPADHYHTAAEVEKMIEAAGFKKIRGLYHPLWLPLFPLFRISAWRKNT